MLNISDEDKDNVTTTQSSSPSPESDADEQTTTSSSSSTGSSDNGFEFQAPSLNTTVFSDFVDTMQNKVADLRERVQNVDSDKLVADSIDSSKGLVDNFLAGDWLNRGELYGAFQIALVLFLFKKPVSMDVIVALVTGPMMILAGAGISAKALWDLGVKNVSIWPAPVPDGTLKTEGLYEIVRHPIYSGLLLSSIGFAVATHSPARLAVCVGLAVLLAKKINVEEDFLLEAYGDYADYQDKVPYKILPKVY